MEKTAMFYMKFNALPDSLKKQVIDFVDFLAERKQKNKKKKKPILGSCKGMFEMSPDFDEPLDDFKDYMY